MRDLELICKYLLDDMHTELIHKEIPYGKITRVYGKAHMIVM
jgi:hypothetical protein